MFRIEVSFQQPKCVWKAEVVTCDKGEGVLVRSSHNISSDATATKAAVLQYVLKGLKLFALHLSPPGLVSS